MKLSFIIVNYKSEKYLAKCISSIREKVFGVDYEIIVVNNDTTPLPLPFIKGGNKGGLKTINTGKNIGFGAACNVGAREAQGEILCFLNPDTEIVTEQISELIQEFNRDQEVGIIGSRLVNENGKTQEWIAGKEVTIWSIIMNNLGWKRDKIIWESKNKLECAWVSGAAMFVKKNVFEKLGGFDENFFMYFEDIDLCRRARLAGYKVLYFPDFTIKHFGGKSFLDKREQKRYYRKSQRRYFLKS